ncbi:M56 family metallopeptidase [Ekhidna sp. To15]|uniref:M56 family metallopeptidase n=1 Tax=Ekhidna sp. To15 TaxID=3395267 RepID=UPI003F5221BE
MESYLLQSSVALAGFYLLYRLLIIRENNQQMKRFMGLLIALFCSSFLLMPSFQTKLEKEFPVVVQDALISVDSFQSTLEFTPPEGTSIWQIIYFIGVGIFALRFLIGLGGIIRLLLASDISRKWGFYLVETKASISPFSFFNFLFIKKEEVEKPGLEPIIHHEQYHKDQLHSVDAILLEVLTILFWFNPFIWLLQRDIKASHEFLADDYVITGKGFDKRIYQDLLFEARTGVSFKSVNYLSNQTSLKQRFNMMEKRKTHSKTSFIRAGIVLAAMAISLFTTAFSSTYQAGDSQLNIQIYTANGLVNLDEGIPKDTDKLYVRMLPSEGEDLKLRVTKTELTLVVGGMGRGQLKGGEVIDLAAARIATAEEKSTLLLEIKEYQTMNSENIVSTIIPEESVFFSIPVN